jgi:hypothetical protein
VTGAGRARIGGVLAAVLLSLLAAAPAGAHGSTAADCSIVVHSHLTPGVVALTPRSGTHDTGGETGSIGCTGTLDGHRVVGTGSFGFVGDFHQITCVSDTSPLSGRYSMTVPTDAGPIHFTGTITDARLAVLDQFTLTQDSGRFVGTSVVAPIVGDCVLAPVTDILITIVGSFRS